MQGEEAGIGDREREQRRRKGWVKGGRGMEKKGGRKGWGGRGVGTREGKGRRGGGKGRERKGGEGGKFYPIMCMAVKEFTSLMKTTFLSNMALSY